MSGDSHPQREGLHQTAVLEVSFRGRGSVVVQYASVAEEREGGGEQGTPACSQ